MRRSAAKPSRAAVEAPGTRILVGVGNDLRGDDGAGLAVARRLAGMSLAADVRVVEDAGEAATLIEHWGPTDAAIVVDAAGPGAHPGKIRHFDAIAEALPAALRAPSSHVLGVAEAIELARALGRLPRSLVVHAIEGERFELGGGLSLSVERAAGRLAERLGAELGSPPRPRLDP